MALNGKVVQGAVGVVRIAIGLLLIVAGGLKIGHFADLASVIAAFRLLPSFLVAPMAIALPFFEVGLGLYLVAGFCTRAAALLATIEFAVFAAAIASVVVRGIPTSCGCFGPADATPASWLDVVRDLALTALAAFVAWRAPGMLAVDRRMETSS